MKKTYFLLTALITALSAIQSMGANVTFNVNVSDPESLKCTVGEQPYEISKGDNAFNVEEYTRVLFSPVAPYTISRVTDQNGTAQSVYNGQWEIYPSSYMEGYSYSVVTVNLDEFRTASCTVNVDDPGLIKAQLSGYNTNLEFSEGSNILKFDPDFETQLLVSPAMYDKSIYEVTLDGTPVTPSYGSYTIPLSQDCEINITAVIPDKDITVSFGYSEDGEGALAGVTVDGNPVEDFDGTSLLMKAGQQLGFSSNPLFKIEETLVNGMNIGWSGGYTYTMTVMDDTEIFVTAHPLGTLKATVIIDDPSNITLYRGYSYQNDIINLNSGENEIELPENNNIISWTANEGCYITSVAVGSETLDGYTTSYSVTDGMVIEFVTGKIVMDMQAVVWIDRKETANQYFSLQSNDRRNIDIENGYNLVEFYEGMNPFGLSWYADEPAVGKVFIDGEQLSPMYEGGTSYQFELENNSVLKIFLDEEPVECNVSFVVAENLEAEVTRDIITEVTSLSDGFTCFKGTNVAVSGSNLIVRVNDEPVEADGDGRHVFIVSEQQTTVTIDGITVGVGMTESTPRFDDKVYDLSGTCVGRRSGISSLAPGIYIVGGDKIVIK